jgi:hypothetical protein
VDKAGRRGVLPLFVCRSDELIGLILHRCAT